MLVSLQTCNILFARVVFDAAIAVIAVATTVVVATGIIITVTTASVATVIVVTATDKAGTHVSTLQTCNIILLEPYLMQLYLLLLLLQL